MSHSWFKKVFEIDETHLDRNSKIRFNSNGNILKTKSYNYLVGEFDIQSLESIKKKARQKALSFLHPCAVGPLKI